MLKIIVNSSNNTDVGENLIRDISATIEDRLGRFSERLTRIEAYIGDEDGKKSGANDKRCMLEARPEGMRPLHITEHDGTVLGAVRSATHKMERMLDDTFHRREDIKAQADRLAN